MFEILVKNRECMFEIRVGKKGISKGFRLAKCVLNISA